MSYYSSTTRNKNLNDKIDLFYIFCFVGLAVLVVIYVFYLPAREHEEKQNSKNILIAEELIAKELKIDKKNFDVELKKEEAKLMLNSWTSNKVNCFVFANGKRFEVSLEMEQIDDHNTFKPVKIKRIVER
ncbi:hypothetical protein P5G86_24135 [Paenibacillus jamilae]|uniref:hypothetical protein n=1 Tax=Bacillus cereus group TaxID=86661 RepID=UPI001298CFBE|nr:MULTISPECIES: hypothetical protein [Bacillus cereus group]MEB4843083.1 hypothetical protein [Paenibacillus jamilae]MEB8830920.1 hypothetical protein [Bacillus cereus]MCR6856607.1 hypothetical protein [Bacillus thuringiensis]MEB9274904.1 hypothetical protein [Bacillus cereus]MEC3037301.1 hypothetical protein [Bacillus cereus]